MEIWQNYDYDRSVISNQIGCSIKTIWSSEVLIFSWAILNILCPWLGSPLRWSGSGRKNLFKDYSPMGDWTIIICHQNSQWHQTCAVMKTCIMTSHVHHSERESVISDCLVVDDIPPRDDDVLSISVRSVTSSCSLASEILERARSRRDQFWGRPQVG